MNCSIDGCEKPVAARGWCGMHYRRWQTSGDPLVVLGRRIRPEPERFWEKVDKDGPIPAGMPELGPCWLWTGAKVSKGYGNFTLGNGDSTGAHRWSYEHHVGPIPGGLTLDHLCRVRSCVNPSHLDPCTAVENYLRGDTGGLQHRMKTHCPKGHPYDEENTYHFTGRSGSAHRGCKECRRETTRRQNEQKRIARGGYNSETHCRNGHPYDEANTRLETRKDGRIVRHCRTCRRGVKKRYRERQA